MATLPKATMKRAQAVLKANDYSASEWYRELPPTESNEPAELLFRGRYDGNPRLKTKGDIEDSCFTLTLWPDGTGFVTEGW